MFDSYEDYLIATGEMPDPKEEREAVRDMWRELYDDDRR